MAMLGGNCSSCCGCGRCVVNGQVDHDYRTQAECERCRRCIEMFETECNGDCPDGSLPSESLVTLEFSSEECGSGGGGSVVIGCGTILSATITSGGSGYATETITEPTLTATVSGGTGGVLSINGYSKIVGGLFDGYYVPTGISVVSGGTGYTDNSPVTLSLGANDEWAPSSATPDIKIRTKVDPPADEWTLTVYSEDGMNLSAGAGLALSITLAPIQYYDGWFEATGVTITNGGSGYQVGELIIATVLPDGDFGETALDITSVDQNGAVTGLSIAFPGQHEGTDTGVISSVVISSNRASRKRTVSTCPVTVTIAQQAPSVGTGATITATVDSTPASPTFGRVTGLTVTNGGSGYVALCEKKTTVASCDECPPRESPESATCEETGGCPCGTWVVDNNQQPCECCQWTLTTYAVGSSPSEGNSQEQNDCLCNAFNQAFEDMGAAFEAAGWTVSSGPPPDGAQCGGTITAVCEECERAVPDPFSGFGGDYRAPCNRDHWVDMPSFSLGTACGGLAFIGYPSLACVKGGQIVAGEAYGLDRYYADGKFYIPKCGQRITECKCCQLVTVIPTGLILEELDAACCGDCPQGPGPQYIDENGNAWQTTWACRSGRCNPLP